VLAVASLRTPTARGTAAGRHRATALYARHAWALVTADVDGLAALYTEDAVIDDVQTGRQHWNGHNRVVRPAGLPGSMTYTHVLGAAAEGADGAVRVPRPTPAAAQDS
jgi:hypothetical protein